jgi:glycosyltransferase involved in cell wall biosynthesis
VIKVSVIVPVYNPGRHIDHCIRSLLGQSMASDEYELIFVDDGSTDDTPARLDELAAAHANVRVEHTPNSGWPGRPRNIGIELARGEFVYFVDNDDWLGPQALERLHATALRNDADIVIGKVVGHGKVVARSIFRHSHDDVALDWKPLLRLLTPHKLFRKEMLDEHGIRFPEGRRRLEDHMFVVHAYFHARRISIVADYPCYHWMLRDSSASWKAFDPVGYFDNVREVLDLVEEHTEPGPLREQMYAHWYRSKMLQRVGGGSFVRREPDYRRKLYEEIRRLALERYGRWVNVQLPYHLRVRSNLLLEGSYESLSALASFESALQANVTIRRETWTPHKLTLELVATMAGADQPLAFAREGQRVRWLTPSGLGEVLGDEDLDVTEALPRSRVELLLRSTANRAEYVVSARSASVFVRGGDTSEAKQLALVAVAEVDARKAAAGSPLRPGDWKVVALMHVAGFTAEAPVSAAPSSGRSIVAWIRRRRTPPLVLSVTKGRRLIRHPRAIRRRIARRLPRLARVVRRARAAAARA